MRYILNIELTIPFINKTVSLYKVWAITAVFFANIGGVKGGSSTVLDIQTVSGLADGIDHPTVPAVMLDVCKPNYVSVYSQERNDMLTLDLCLPEEEIQADSTLQLVKNVPHLRQAKVVVFAETHNNVEGQQLQKRARIILSKARKNTKHVQLVESRSHTLTFACDRLIKCICTSRDGMQTTDKQILIDSDAEEYIKSKNKTALANEVCRKTCHNLVPPFPSFYTDTIENDLTCAGFDEPEADFATMRRQADDFSLEQQINKLVREKIFAIGKKIVAAKNSAFDKKPIIQMLDEILEVLNNHKKPLPKHLKELRSLLTKREEIISKPDGLRMFFDRLGAMGPKLENAMKKIEALALKAVRTEERNKFMIKATQKWAGSTSGIVFLTVGKQHVFPDGSAPPYDLTKIKSTKPQYRFAQYLQTVPHAVFVLPDTKIQTQPKRVL